MAFAVLKPPQTARPWLAIGGLGRVPNSATGFFAHPSGAVLARWSPVPPYGGPSPFLPAVSRSQAEGRALAGCTPGAAFTLYVLLATGFTHLPYAYFDTDI